MESARRGASGMDAARGLGVPTINSQGWPLYADPGAWMERGKPSAANRGRLVRMQGQDLLVPFGGAGHPGDCQKGLAQQGETNASANPANAVTTQTQSRRMGATHQALAMGFAHPTL